MERERDGVVGLGGEEMYMFGNEKKKKKSSLVPSQTRLADFIKLLPPRLSPHDCSLLSFSC